MRSFILKTVLLLSMPAVLADTPTVRAIVSDSNAPPYALFTPQGGLTGGISKDILEEAVTRSSLRLQYLPLPRGRVEQWLQKNDADIACFLNPAWVEQPTQLLWSTTLFTTRQVIVRRSNSPAITSVNDLTNMHIGTERGFSYPELDALFSTKVAIRDDATTLENNLNRLQMKRVDAVLTVDLAYAYYQQLHNSAGLAADPLWAEPVGVYCALNRQQAHITTPLLNVLQQMVVDGSIKRILQRYKPN